MSSPAVCEINTSTRRHWATSLDATIVFTSSKFNVAFIASRVIGDTSSSLIFLSFNRCHVQPFRRSKYSSTKIGRTNCGQSLSSDFVRPRGRSSILWSWRRSRVTLLVPSTLCTPDCLDERCQQQNHRIPRLQSKKLKCFRIGHGHVHGDETVKILYYDINSWFARSEMGMS